MVERDRSGETPEASSAEASAPVPRRISVIVGSVRAKRIGRDVAAWVAEVGRAVTPHEIDVQDLRDWRLPLDDEPEIPAMNLGYAQEHTRAWSQFVTEREGFVFVIPQYNGGYPAAVKNALDHLKKEWAGKPALIVSYAMHGGGPSATQLRAILEHLRMLPVPTMPAFCLSRELLGSNPGRLDAEKELSSNRDELERGFSELAAALDALQGNK